MEASVPASARMNPSAAPAIAVGTGLIATAGAEQLQL